MPSECILSESDYKNSSVIKILAALPSLNTFCFQNWSSVAGNAEKYLKKELKITSLYSTGLDGHEGAAQASAALYAYLKETQKEKLFHIIKITQLHDGKHIALDRATIYNLELFSPIRDGSQLGTLVSVLDKTQTAAGGRLLRQWIRQPLSDKLEIEKRLLAVQELIAKYTVAQAIKEQLKVIPDIERILARISVGIGNARDLVAIKNALCSAHSISLQLNQLATELLQSLNQTALQTACLQQIINQVDTHILDDPSFDPKDGNIIKSGVNSQLDALRKKMHSGQEWVNQLEIEERQRTGITSLKVRFNKVFGFYIEISNANLSNIPENYLRKQTLVNGERFITPELKKQEEIILTAEEKSKEIEYQIFQTVQQEIIKVIPELQQVAAALATIDCLVNFAAIAQENRYNCPTINQDGRLHITQGRHPIVEKLLAETLFVPNDALLDQQNQLMLITGPNMAGKSVYMRQVALITLMAHIGSFVPAQTADIALVDKIFVRSGASDMISAGLSTFMVEMVETAYILQHATKDSLIIMDEIGRGTSTYDGISIAWAVAESIVTDPRLRTKTLFATHYHELQKLAAEHPGKIKNYHMAIQEEDGQPVFLHIIKEGGAAHSFGIAVAKLAGVPEEVIESAEHMLKNLEVKSSVPSDQSSGKVVQAKEQLAFAFTNKEEPIIQEIQEIDIHQLTPLQALNKLAEIKNKLKLLHYAPKDFHQAD
jgi:DNA mismatch repair protein MutS